jgi:Leucine-rich repeat (LRR) protein
VIGPVPIRGSSVFAQVVTDVLDAAQDREQLAARAAVLGLDLAGETLGRGLTQLRELYLTDTQVSDAGLEHLRRLTQLENLNLSNTQVTDAGVNELKKALPDVEISR